MGRLFWSSCPGALRLMLVGAALKLLEKDFWGGGEKVNVDPKSWPLSMFPCQ